ncbi:protein AF1q [Gadus macrocephalus]|uniref:protein AF1q n=1 Tax=Gadus macrocephalus TaxID=80720 RepID=UPI0028CB2705|nr:protein AF1q [Gadus macrocephalus]
MLEKSNSQYDSFLFWKQPILAPDLSELEVAMEGKAGHAPQGRARTALKRSQEEEVAWAEYSSFNYWRAPIPDIDSLMADLDLLLL